MSNKYSSYNIANNSFKLGVLLLITLPLISGILFLISSILILISNKNSYLKDRFNYPLIAITLFLISSTLIKSFLKIDKVLIGNWDNSLNWIGLINWIPFFLLFWTFQPFLKTKDSRIRISKLYIFGSVPFVISGIGQYWFNLNGPFIIFDGLISIFQRPIEGDAGITSFFNNQNYAGSWLLFILPLSIANTIIFHKRKVSKILFLIVTFGLIITLIYTKSRNSWIGSVITIPLLFSFKIIPYFLIFIFLCVIIFSFISSELKINLINFLKDFTFNKFSYLGFNDFENYTRISIWITTIKNIIQKPFFGWGSATFPIVYASQHNEYYTHSHNLYIELAYHYGLFPAVIFIFFIINILFKTFKKIYLNQTIKNYFERAWFTSLITFFISQLFDIQYYDFRISVTFWILLSGSVCIIKDKNYNKSSSLIK